MNGIDWIQLDVEIKQAELDKAQGKLSWHTTRDTLLWAAKELVARREQIQKDEPQRRGDAEI